MKKILTIGSVLMLTLQLFAQDDVQALSARLALRSAAGVQEKLYVHSDKDFYVTGEVIWFKLYSVDVIRNKPLTLSRVAYVELLSRDGKAALQAKIAMDNATGNGSFQLPYSFLSGHYTLRAYTSQMRNTGPGSFFEKAITIVNTLRAQDNPPPAATDAETSVQFFPEGGDLVDGLTSTVAFHVTGKDGKGKQASGSVIDGNGQVVAVLQTGHAGMGRFELKPAAGGQYTAVLTSEGKTFRKQLPAVAREGMVMQLSETANSKLLLKVQSRLPGNSLSLLVQSRGVPRLALSKNLAGGYAEIILDKEQLGAGVSQLTIMDAQNRARCERLYFNQPAALPLSVTADSLVYHNRGRVMLQLNAGKTMPGSYSVAVYQLDSLQQAPVSDIQSYCWLQSELKGLIEDPGYYFTGDKPAALAADNLMLTQGWRRFNWQANLSQPPATTFIPEIEGHIVNGRLVDKRSGKAVPGKTAFLSVPLDKPLFTTAVSNADGAVRFPLRHFYGGSDIVVQPEHADDNIRVEITSPFDDRLPVSTPVPLYMPESMAGALTAHSLQAQVTSSFHTDQLQKFLYPAGIDTMPFYGTPDHRYYLDDYTRFITMEEVIKEFVSDVRLRKNDQHFSYRVRNTSYNTFFETDPLVLVDGVPVSDADKVIAYDPLKIKRVDVIAQKFYQQQLEHDGIISFQTYQGDMGGFPLDPNVLILSYAGMQLQREFYAPSYETPSLAASRMPDFRNLLYWSPEMNTSRPTTFYTGDTTGSFLVVVQGMNADGLMGVTTTRFTVGK